MDCLKDIEMRFNGHKEIQTLKQDHFTGSVEFHFNDGIPMKYEYKLWRKPKYREPNLTKGGANV